MSIWLQLFSTLIRAALFALFGRLALYGLITEEASQELAESGVYWVVVVGTPILLIFWSMIEKWLQKLRERASLEAPANASPEVVDQKVREMIRGKTGR